MPAQSMQADGDFWLVFKDEGKSLHSLMYSVAAEDGCEGCPKGQGALLHASSWWRQLRTGPQVCTRGASFRVLPCSNCVLIAKTFMLTCTSGSVARHTQAALPALVVEHCLISWKPLASCETHRARSKSAIYCGSFCLPSTPCILPISRTGVDQGEFTDVHPVL